MHTAVEPGFTRGSIIAPIWKSGQCAQVISGDDSRSHRGLICNH